MSTLQDFKSIFDLFSKLCRKGLIFLYNLKRRHTDHHYKTRKFFLPNIYDNQADTGFNEEKT